MERKVVQETIAASFGGTYDVVVIGGGPAGVSAALASARQNKKTLLIEKGCMLGGLATMGLVVLFNPPLDNANGRKLVGGISEELMHLSVKYSYGSLPEIWKYRMKQAEGKQRYQTVFSPAAFALALNDLLYRQGVTILYDALFCTPKMNKIMCEGVFVETKAGRYYYEASAFVDCSGDADLMSRAGAACIQRTENHLSFWALSTNLERMKSALESGNVGNAIHIEALGASPHEDNFGKDLTKFGMNTPEEVAEFIRKGQQIGFEKLKTFDQKQECFVSLPCMPEFRKTRAIQGIYTLDEKDRDQRFEDSIGCTKEEWQPYCIEIPYRCLISNDCGNLYAAGRIISVDGKPRDTTRLIAICALTGEAAGTAAAILCESGCTVQEMDVNRLQRVLQKNDNILHV